uniref:anti-sigma factor n=1 Tax=uncultured Cellulomonas sp. TaxID=189682 RepID=UPI0028EE8F3F
GVPQVGPLAGPRHAVADAPTGPAPSASSSDTSAPGVTHLADRRRPSRTRWLAVAAAVVVGAAVPGALVVQQAQRADQAEEQQQALADLLTDPSAVVVHGDVTGGGVATAVLTDDRALFTATGLPDPGDGKAYQLWVVDAAGAASAGVLAGDAGTVRQLAEKFTAGAALAITVEPAGGSTQPTTDPLVVLSAT